ncbi:MAG: hypothetical protein IPN13_25030 [Bacteroidetes bacterium]|nr:hypothetical protein [Bacteroidota bacterium]
MSEMLVAAPDGTVEYFIAYDRFKPRINSISNPLFSSLNEQTFSASIANLSESRQ